MTLTVVDSEQIIRAWARAEANISASTSGRVFFATPQPYDVKGGRPDNWIVMFLVGEVHEPDDLGMQQTLCQFTCWGKTKALAASTAIAVQNAGRQLQWGPPVQAASAVIQSGSVSQRRWLMDPTTNLARYDVDLLFLIRGTATN